MTMQPSKSSLIFMPQHLAIELREGAQVRAVDHCLLEVSDHTESMSARRRNGLRPLRRLIHNRARSGRCAHSRPMLVMHKACRLVASLLGRARNCNGAQRCR
jgi:hypothetical protein